MGAVSGVSPQAASGGSAGGDTLGEGHSCVGSEEAGPSRHALAPTRPTSSVASSREPTTGFYCLVTLCGFTLDPPVRQQQWKKQEPRVTEILNVCFPFSRESMVNL